MSTLLNPFAGNQNVPDLVETGFNKFLTRIRTTPSESSAAASHRKSIESALENAFSMTAFFRTGAFGNGTNVACHSDVDYFAVIPNNRLKQNSSLTLEEVASVLRERFPFTSVRVNGPSVVVPFGIEGCETTEIVPVDFTGFTQLGFRQFDMPDGNGGWMFTAPESHKGYVDWLDEKHSGKVKPLIRFLKAWNFKRNAGIKSFFLEMWAAKHASQENCILYDIDLKKIFETLFTGGLFDLPDPRFPYDNLMIRACSTEGQRSEASKKILAACAWSQQAVQMRFGGKAADAVERWDLVFNHEFPTQTGSF